MTVLSIDLSLFLLYNMFVAKSITILLFYSTIFILKSQGTGVIAINDINLYEEIPHEQFPIRILVYRENEYNFPQHWHEHTELHYIFKGNCRLKYGDASFELKSGDLAVINGNELHRGAGGKCDYICIIVPPAFFEQNHAIFEKVVRSEYVSDVVEKIYESHKRGDAADLLEIKGNMYFLVSYLIRNFTVKTLGDNTYSGYVNKLNRVNEAIKYMSGNYDKAITTSRLADMAHLSEGYFCQMFKDVTGKTAMEYLNNLRIDKAEKLLKKTEMTVTEIAFCCGFEDANYFSRTFKKIKGKNPQSVRLAVNKDQNGGKI